MTIDYDIQNTDRLNDLTSRIIRAAITVHKEMGPGLMESVYQRCLAIELEQQGLDCTTEVPVPVMYRGQNVHSDAFRIDLLVCDEVILELKATEDIKPVHKKQILTYLRLTGKKVGLLINFNETQLKNGITRVVNNL